MRVIATLGLLVLILAGRAHAQDISFESAGLTLGSDYSGSATVVSNGVLDGSTLIVGGNTLFPGTITAANPFTLNGVLTLNTITSGPAIFTLTTDTLVTDEDGDPATLSLDDFTLSTGTLNFFATEAELTPETQPGVYIVTVAAPEPATWLLLASSAVALAMVARRRLA